MWIPLQSFPCELSSNKHIPLKFRVQRSLDLGLCWPHVVWIVLLFAISGCGTFVPITDTSEVPEPTLSKAYRVKVITAGSSVETPNIYKYLGAITTYSCKHLLWDPPASKGDALLQLQIKAIELGANGIVDVTFDIRGTDTCGTNCWETVQASGVAVRFEE